VKKVVPIEYVKGKEGYRSIIAVSVAELKDDVFYPCSDSFDEADIIYKEDIVSLPIAEVQVFNPEDNIVETKSLIIDNDFAYEIEGE